MKRILVIGSCGAGKSYFSRALSQKLNLPLIHLDHLFWEPNWKQRHREDFDRDLEQQLARPEWIMDGNYNRTLGTRLKYADTVIHLDYNRWICLYRVIKRWKARELHAEGCPSKIDIPFLWYVFHGYPQKHRLRPTALKKEFPHIQWIELLTPKAATKFLNTLADGVSENSSFPQTAPSYTSRP